MKKLLSHQINQKQILGLDGLRAIAVIGIVLYHMFPSLIKGGFLGVNLFFVLSGYLMAVTSQNAWEKHKFSLGSFYKKRIIRIYPALLLTVCGTAILLMIFIPSAMRGIRSEAFSIIGGYNNWWQISQNASYFTKINGTSAFTHIWSLAIELQYYLIWPLLFIICICIKRWIGNKGSITFLLFLAACSVLAMVLIYQPGEDPSRVYYGTDTRFFSLLLGSALGLSHNQQPGRRRRRRGVKYLVFFLVSVLLTAVLFFVVDGQSSLTYQLILPLSSLLFAALIFLVSIPELPFGQWLDCKPLSFIGKRSYEIYLCQYPIGVLFQQWSRGKNILIMSVLELIIVFGVSILMYQVSSQIIRLGRLKNEK